MNRCEISIADIQRFFAGKHITGCPVCGHHGWRLDEASGGATAASVNERCIVVVCQNCGFVGFHQREIIARWLNCHRVA